MMNEGKESLRNRLRIAPGSLIVAVVGYLIVLGICLMFFTGRRADHLSPGTLVGPEACAECHQEQARAWKETRMAKTFEALRPGVMVEAKRIAGLDSGKDYTRDEKCLPCHTTGYGTAGGFVSIEETPEMAGVTCEACHGSGGLFIGVMKTGDPSFDTSEAREARRAGLVYPPTDRICRTCHNEDSPFFDMGYRFDFTRRSEQGTHQHFQLRYDDAPVGR